MTPRIDAIGIVVADIPRSLSFYRRLGLEFPDGAETAPHVEAQLPGGMRLLLDTVDTVRSFDPSWQPPTGGARAGLAFRCDSPAEVDKVYAEMVGAGFEGHKDPWDAEWGQRYALLHDPDGNAVDLFAPSP
ncbi:VOC family protein [Phytohabitans aurantiacus]|uniref:Glyoxalase n=1 Tax=Phytohabitans aurantiacus TaxID=3016789 RepID=A0ABQ5R3B3_9ACTN|nr:VOC family protein [Phytohabitans aurantiacus]GLI01274.1 glyoxalase [Phytohabitans aurantiacus]